MIGWLALGAALGWAWVRVFAGHPSPGVTLRVLSRREVALLDAAGAATFPAGGAIPPSGAEAGIASYVDRWLASVNPRMRRLMRLLFFLVEHATLFLPAPGRGGFRRFTSLRPEQQVAVLEGWRTSQWPARRLVFHSLRAILTMGFFAHPPVLRQLGLEPRKVTRHAADEVIGRVAVFADYREERVEKADVVVVGSGPGGAVAAKELAEAGLSVILLEEGPALTPDDFVTDGALSMARTMRESGLRATTGTVLPTMQAMCLGGGSVVNSAICLRAPEFVLDEWCERYQLRHTTRADLDPHYDAVGQFLGIARTPEPVLGRRNVLFREGCEKLGYASEPIERNVRGCCGSGECFSGCRARAKQSMDITFVPAAIRAGARVFTSVRVEKVLTDGRRATGVAGRAVQPFTGRPGPAFRVEAGRVVLAAGCMATPVLLERSGNLGNASDQVGRNLRFHPGVAVNAVFEERVDPGFGATQGYQSLQFLRQGFKLETLWAPPGVLAVRTPGSGLELKRRLSWTPHAVVWDAIGSCNGSTGRVRARRSGLDPRIVWHLDRADIPILTHALFRLSEIAFAAGAHTVIAGIHGIPDELHSLDEARVLQTRSFEPGDFVTGGNHAFCTTRMHGDPRQGVVDELGRCHDIENLYIADTGVFPQCPSVNPMWTGMALAHRTARAIAGGH
jgi:choline dehydrogenase-like flavoprotein